MLAPNSVHTYSGTYTMFGTLPRVAGGSVPNNVCLACDVAHTHTYKYTTKNFSLILLSSNLFLEVR
jgi:hypothetical protein